MNLYIDGQIDIISVLIQILETRRDLLIEQKKIQRKNRKSEVPNRQQRRYTEHNYPHSSPDNERYARHYGSGSGSSSVHKYMPDVQADHLTLGMTKKEKASTLLMSTENDRTRTSKPV